MRSCCESTPVCCIPCLVPKNQNKNGTGCREAKESTATKFVKANASKLEDINFGPYSDAHPKLKNMNKRANSLEASIFSSYLLNRSVSAEKITTPSKLGTLFRQRNMTNVFTPIPLTYEANYQRQECLNNSVQKTQPY